MIPLRVWQDHLMMIFRPRLASPGLANQQSVLVSITSLREKRPLSPTVSSSEPSLTLISGSS